MKHSNKDNSSNSSATSAGVASPVGTKSGAHGDRPSNEARAIALEATRELRGPLGALRVLLEGSRGNAKPAALDFADRALEEIERAEAAANDLIAWSLPRSLRSTSTSLGEIATSLLDSLTPSLRRRTHLVVEQDATTVQTDAPLLVECFSRSLRHAFRDDGTGGLEVMVHIHAADDIATFSFIHTGSPKASLFHAHGDAVLTLSDEILNATVARLGGKSSNHEAEGHRCTVITLPLTDGSKDRTGSIQ